MQLARSVAAHALADLAEPEQPPAPPLCAPAPRPDLAPQPEPDPEPAPARPRAAGADLRAPTCTAPTCTKMSAALVFIRLADTVRACMVLEARIAAAAPAAARAAPPPRPADPSRADPSRADPQHADPRREPLREAFRAVTERHPRGAERLREATARLDEILAFDTAQTIDEANLFYAICEEVGITIDLAILPDADLDLIPEPPDTPPPDD